MKKRLFVFFAVVLIVDKSFAEDRFVKLEAMEDKCQEIKVGSSPTEARHHLGTKSKMPEERWSDVFHRHSVTMWTLATVPSGSSGVYLIFADNKVDFCGRMMASEIRARYGKPGAAAPWIAGSPSEYRWAETPTPISTASTGSLAGGDR